MKSGAFKRAIGLTLLYIGCFVSLVFLQFSRGPGFSERFGRLAVNVTFRKGDRGGSAKIAEAAKLEYAGLSLEISKRYPALLKTSSGASRQLAPKSVEKLKDGARILLEGGVELRAAIGQGDRLSLSASAPAGSAELRLRYGLAGRTRLVPDKGGIRLESGASVFDLAFASSSFNLDSGYLVLGGSGEADGLGRLAVVPRAAAPARPAQAGPAEQLVAQAPKDQAAFAAEISAWRDKVWAGLSAGRFDAAQTAWRGKSEGQAAEARFSERALAAYLAESLARGYYAEALAKMRPAKERHPADLGYLSAPYLGGLVRKMEAMEASDQVEAKRLAQLVLDKSPDILAKEGLVLFLLDRAPASLARDALSFVATIDPAKLGVRQAVGLLSCVVQSRSYLKDEENPFRALASAADLVVKAARRAESGLFLATEEDGSTDVRLSLLAGLELAAFGEAEGKPELVGIGQGLVEGFLGLADDQGIAPARVLVRSGAIEQRSGSLLPEDAYALAAANPYYPRQVSFYRSIGPGVWAWTCSPSLSVTANETHYSFSVSFPEGRSHYMAFYGIKPFANIQLYDIDYSPDVEFEIYDASGYLYRNQARSLDLKMKHKKESESIKLYF